MLKFLLALILLLAPLAGVRAQPCNGSVSLYTQADVDNFPSYNLTVINASLVIQTTGNITNLNALAGVTRVCGDLILLRNSNLVSLNGLQNITSVGGNLVLDSNSRLTDLTGLNSLQTIGGSFSLFHNDNLTSLNGLGALRSIGGNLGTDNSNLRLPNLQGLTALRSIGGNLSITGANFVNLQGLNRIKSIGGLFLNAIASAAGLDSLSTINGELSIRFTRLTDMAPVGQLTGITALTIEDNTTLSTCNVPSVCRVLQSPNGRRILIRGNAGLCSTEPIVLSQCSNATSAVDPRPVARPTVHPNPARDIIENGTRKPYKVYDTRGQIRLQDQGRAATIDVSALPSGLYYLAVDNKVAKFIKE